jgi:DNA-binding CsgD family transcriptional regulator/PAS domain-containing protein
LNEWGKLFSFWNDRDFRSSSPEKRTIAKLIGLAMTRDEGVLDLVGDIYDCAIEPNKWPATLERLVKYVGGESAAISLQDPLKREVRLVAQWGVDARFEQIMHENMPLNPLLSMGWFVDVDEPFTGEKALGQEDYLNCRFYKEVVAPNGFYDAALAVLAKGGNRFGSLSVPGKERFTDTTLEKLRVLAPHVRRAVTIADLLGVRTLQQDMLSATLDLLTVGIILIDDGSRIVHANAAGIRLLDERTAVRRDGSQLSCRDPKVAINLKLAIETAASGNTVEFPKSGIAVPITSTDGGDLAAWILPLDRGLRIELAAPFAASVAVFLRQMGDTSPFPGELFVKRFGISPAECRVLMMLTQGMSPREAAETLGISEPTAKSHLQRLFQKTGTDRQADLMRLAMSALAPAGAQPL